MKKPDLVKLLPDLLDVRDGIQLSNTKLRALAKAQLIRLRHTKVYGGEFHHIYFVQAITYAGRLLLQTIDRREP